MLKGNKHMKTMTNTSYLALALFACFALSPGAQAVSPAPDGGYPGLNTAEGTNALFSLTTGVWDTAIGAQALYHDTTGSGNTAVGLNAMFNNISGGSNTAVGVYSLFGNTNGGNNTAVGNQALKNNKGDSNTGGRRLRPSQQHHGSPERGRWAGSAWE
jgi:hypothetical protein